MQFGALLEDLQPDELLSMTNHQASSLHPGFENSHPKAAWEGQLLVVLDTQSRQTRVYKFSYQQAGVEFKPQFSLVEKKVFDSKTNVEPVRPATFQPFNKP